VASVIPLRRKPLSERSPANVRALVDFEAPEGDRGSGKFALRGGRPEILLVDHHEESRRHLTFLLTDAKYRVQATQSGEHAIGLIEGGERFDVVIAEASLPDFSGTELLRRVRQMDPDVPVVLLTANPTLEEAMLVVEQRGFRYLGRPCADQVLLDATCDAVATHHLAVLKRRAFEQFEPVDPHWQRASLEERLNEALDALWIAYQPIVQWPANEIFGMEGLVRSDGGGLTNPKALFDAAERLGRVRELGRAVRRAVAHAMQPSEGPMMFVNLHAADLADDELYAPSAPLSAFAHRTVLEITERSSLEQIEDLETKMARLRGLGYRIAVDDLGAGYAGLKSFSELEPEIAKLDMSLIRGIDASSRKRSLVRSMISVCTHELGVYVVCEGVETEAERDALAGIGGTLLQGYLFGKPQRQ
jgi:EAL domain-containing protein (putative c-di-GMP-specific phosphodiesterase class I)/FixJ family two-component response regulator